MVDIAFEHARKMPADLSGGMIKRIALARALALDPELLFLDEPTAGLDPDRSDSFVELILSLHQQLRLTVIMVTHDLDSLFALSSRIAVLAEKHVVTIGTPREVVAYQHPFIRSFFLGGRGERAMEVLPPQTHQEI
jgi:phospholipid/cholesterol/gamma-HCH transport system ATP-binding protein